MNYHFPYREFEPVEIPDDRIAGVYELTPAPDVRSDDELIRDALRRPIGSGPLRGQVSPGMRIALAVDDNSRNTRTDLMLPAVLAELAAAGIPPSDITVFIALGTHRPMTTAEIRDKYTPAAVARHRVVNPDWRDRAAYVSVGHFEGDVDIRIHREIVEADFVVGIGQTIPHMIAGFGGGGKIINPGCSDGETIGHMHWMCNRVPSGELFAVRDNPVRAVIDEAAVKAGLKFIINEVPGAQGRLAGVFAGDPVLAHWEACACARRACLVEIDQPTEIVLADAYPADIDFWQALKGLNAASGAVKPGGTVILVSPCPEGTSSQHHELTDVGYVDVDTIRRLVAAGTLDLGVAANLLLGRLLLDKAGAILVTRGISEAETRAMHLGWAASPQEAIAQALRRHGPAAKINILHKASKMICVAKA